MMAGARGFKGASEKLCRCISLLPTKQIAPAPGRERIAP